MNILVAEDNPTLASALEDILVREGHGVKCAANGPAALEAARAYPFDIIVLDVMLPGMTGFDVIRCLREEKNDTPTLILTALSEVQDKIAGLNAGADDYMTKPFDVDEFLARVNALSRRRGTLVMDRIAFSDLSLELTDSLLSRGERSVQLSRRELSVMRLLMEEPGRTVPKESLLLKVWGADSGATDNNVEAYISFLRKKLRLLASDVRIRSVHGVGYRLEA